MSVTDILDRLFDDPASAINVSDLRRAYLAGGGEPMSRSLFLAALARAGLTMAHTPNGQVCVVGKALEPPTRLAVQGGRVVRVPAA